MSSEENYFRATGPVPGDDGAQAAFYTLGSNIRTGALIVGIDAGVIGGSDTGPGVTGNSRGADSPGVQGFGNPGVSGSATGKGHGIAGGAGDVNAAGVWGVNNGGGVGVRGQASSGDGVQGFTLAADRSGVAGVNQSGGVGTFGFSANGDGMLAISGGAGHGVLARSTNGIGIYASTLNASSVAVVGVAPTRDGLAGVFQGRLAVIGSFVTYGAKSAAVIHPDGSHRLLYAVESPESWFEDFGEAALTDGSCTVALDADFMALVKDEPYHVFVSPYAESPGLYVSRRGKLEFEVREHGGGRGRIRFSYRVVARRRDIVGTRLAKVAVPHVPPPPELHRPTYQASA
jgi:hypothetical protein